MATGDINDAASQIPGIALADDSSDPSDLGAGYALLKFKGGLPVWLPNGGAVRTAVALGATSQLSTLTEEAAPLDADLFLMERASDGALRKVQAQNLPGGGVVGGFYDAYVNVQDQKAQNTAGGTFTSGAWQTRDLNTKQADTANIATLAANQVTLPAGDYVCHIECPAVRVDSHQARLQNITAGTTLLVGTSAESQASDWRSHAPSLIAGKFTLEAESVLEVQHRCLTTLATNGFGLQANFATEVYTVAEFWRLA